MTLEPLLTAPLLIQIHAFAALSALALGIFQLAAPKGTNVIASPGGYGLG